MCWRIFFTSFDFTDLFVPLKLEKSMVYYTKVQEDIRILVFIRSPVSEFYQNPCPVIMLLEIS